MPTIEEIKAKLHRLQTQTKKQRDIWKPSNEHTVRLLPYPHGDEPFIDMGFHYEIGQTIICPRYNFGKDCVVCEYADKLRSWQDEDGEDKLEAHRKRDWDLFRKIQCKERYYAPMIECGKESEGPKFWGFGKTIYERLLGFCIDEKYNEAVTEEGHGVLTNPDCAFDLKVTFKKRNNEDGKGNDKPFGITEVETASLKPSKLGKNGDTQELLNNVKNMGDVYPEMTSAEVEKIYFKFINSGTAEPKDDEDVGTEYKANTAEKQVEGGQSIDEAFDKMAKQA